tara:strand:+ start:419 stop:541 length:123 start_codon:yes stop_codon:yes gene_type:complete
MVELVVELVVVELEVEVEEKEEMEKEEVHDNFEVKIDNLK